MPAKDDPVVIKKYANRRLYNTGTSTYVTLEDLAEMVKRGEEFTVKDAKSGEDITHPVLTQIIFELENKDGQNMLPISFLRQLISFYGDQMQMVVPSFLEQSMIAFAREQERMREQMKAAFGQNPMDMMNMTTPMKAIEEQARRNIEMFQNAMQMFTPFPSGGQAVPENGAENDAAPDDQPDELSELKDQIKAMQRKLDSLGRNGG
ncbi:MAG: polyhydroxyalkanoate synthesis repressor PhaR [Rhizobiaceae bacterium]|nr:polyhydroxyalkanoate synthesis repressor PhaR [Rhizobiaceae bacterium]